MEKRCVSWNAGTVVNTARLFPLFPPIGAAQAFPWAEGCAPADDLAGAGKFELLLEHMDHSLVAGALLSQPKEHGFDHSYVAAAIKKHKKRFRGICLANPNLPRDEVRAGHRPGVRTLLRSRSFCGPASPCTL